MEKIEEVYRCLELFNSIALSATGLNQRIDVKNVTSEHLKEISIKAGISDLGVVNNSLVTHLRKNGQSGDIQHDCRWFLFSIEQALGHLHKDGRELFSRRIARRVCKVFEAAVFSHKPVSREQLASKQEIQIMRNAGLDYDLFWSFPFLCRSFSYKLCILFLDAGVDIQKICKGVISDTALRWVSKINLRENLSEQYDKEIPCPQHPKAHPKSVRAYVLYCYLENKGLIKDGSKMKFAEFIEFVTGGNPDATGKSADARKYMGEAPTPESVKIAKGYLSKLG